MEDNNNGWRHTVASGARNGIEESGGRRGDLPEFNRSLFSKFYKYIKIQISYDNAPSYATLSLQASCTWAVSTLFSEPLLTISYKSPIVASCAAIFEIL
jgi:hypothetical protein